MSLFQGRNAAASLEAIHVPRQLRVEEHGIPEYRPVLSCFVHCLPGRVASVAPIALSTRQNRGEVFA
jgi:hypothetical protein